MRERSAGSSCRGRGRRAGAGPSRRRPRRRPRRARPRRRPTSRSWRPARAAGRRGRGRRRRAAPRRARSRAASSTSATSPSRSARRCPAAEERGGDVAGGLRARREDARVHLHAGRDAEHGTRSPTASWMSRAVPSPPAKSISSTPRRDAARPRRRACRRRSSPRPRLGRTTLVVEARAQRRGRRPSRRRGDDPSAVAAPARAARAPARRGRRDGVGPELERAALRSAPSVPFSPTRPPMPAIGLTISPSADRSRERASLRSSAATSSTARRAMRDHLVELVLGDHERRRERDRVRRRAARG